MIDSTSTTRSAAAQNARAWERLALEEYQALRGEILATMETQDGGLRFGVAALGVASTAGFSVWDDETAAGTAIFLFIVPFVSAVTLVVWMGEVTRMMRAGRHIWRLEALFHERLPDLPKLVMSWETRLRDPSSDITRWERHYEWNYNAIVFMFWSIGAAAIGAGIYRALLGDAPLANREAIALAVAIISAAHFATLVLILRQLATVCATEGWLRILRRSTGASGDDGSRAGAATDPAGGGGSERS